jgi:hypothetical protein
VQSHGSRQLRVWLIFDVRQNKHACGSRSEEMDGCSADSCFCRTRLSVFRVHRARHDKEEVLATDELLHEHHIQIHALD